jgi:PAS domain S-box-containing protein
VIELDSLLKDDKRLSALNSYNVLDTLPEREFDAIARLASYICEVPIAQINFIDSERHWFKSSIGMDVGGTAMPVEETFCKYTIVQDDIFEVSDTTLSEPYKSADPVTGDFHMRFYAGASLIDPDGYHLGTLCVVDHKPKKLTEKQKDALRTLASEVMSQLVLRKQKKALEASLAFHKDFYTLFNTSGEIHYIANADGKIEMINDAVFTILGFTAQQAIGRSVWEFAVENSRDQFVRQIEAARENQKPFEIQTQTVAADGTMKWISWNSVNQNGKWYASGRDISQQKKIMEELVLLSLVASKIHNGVVISNGNDEVLWVNKGFEKITGYDSNELLNRQLRATIKAKPNLLYKEKYENAVKTGNSYEAELQINHKNGKIVWLSVVNSLLYDDNGAIDKYIRIVVDITARKAAEKELEILSFAARKSPSGTVIRDKDGKIMWMNEASERILGYSLKEMKGKAFGNTLLGEETDMEVHNAAVDKVKHKKPYEVEIKVYRKDKTPIWAFFANSPLLNELGEVDRQITVIVDVTARKRAEEEAKMLSLVASNTTSGVVINDSHGKVEWINSAFEKITGYSLEDVQFKPLGDTLKGELTDISIIERSRELSRNKQSFEVDLLAYRKDGQPLWISVINSVILNAAGEVDKYIEVIIDITAKKKVELELISAKEKALQLNRAKDMFISVMSHEIRTPLNAVIGMSNLLTEDNTNESQRENLSILKFSADNLMSLINDLLDFTKIETGNVELEKANVDLRKAVNGVASSMQFKAKEKGIYIKAHVAEEVPQIIIGDSARLIQILLNLVSNAVKFTHKGGVTIDVGVLEENDKSARIRFAVTDTGIGIANDKLSTIFESFKQAEADTTRKYGGTGLGLAISKRLVELHDSRINVDSVLGQGSTFWFTITFNKANSKKLSDSKMEMGLNLNVLVVDDNQINRILVNKVLQRWGTKVDFAENGQQAIDKVESNKNYDVVLMDVHMPVMGGLEATEKLRAKTDPYFQQLPIVALTASMLSSEVNEMSNAGMNDFILKPFEPKTLFDKLSKYQK